MFWADWRKPISQTLVTRTLAAYLVLSNVYYWYRYAFQINSSVTSPTYADTPLALQVIKYALFIPAYVMLVLIMRQNNIKRNTVWYLLLMFAFQGLISLAVTRDVVTFLKFFFFAFPAALTLYASIDFAEALERVGLVILIYHISYEAIQIIALIMFGRLPALAYANGLIRFGGGWDDPNAFALFLVVPISFFLHRWSSRGPSIRQILLLVSCIVMEVLTISVAGYLGCMIAVALFLVFSKRRRSIIAILCVLVVCALVIVALKWDAIVDIISWKQKSFLIHLNMLILKPATDNGFLSVLFGIQRGFSENLYQIVLTNYGLIGLATLIVIEVIAIVNGIRNYRQDSGNSILYACLALVCVMPIVQIGLPYLTVFPDNFMYWIAAFYCCVDPCKASDALCCQQAQESEGTESGGTAEIAHQTNEKTPVTR